MEVFIAADGVIDQDSVVYRKYIVTLNWGKKDKNAMSSENESREYLSYRKIQITGVTGVLDEVVRRIQPWG